MAWRATQRGVESYHDASEPPPPRAGDSPARRARARALGALVGLGAADRALPRHPARAPEPPADHALARRRVRQGRVPAPPHRAARVPRQVPRGVVAVPRAGARGAAARGGRRAALDGTAEQPLGRATTQGVCERVRVCARERANHSARARAPPPIPEGLRARVFRARDSWSSSTSRRRKPRTSRSDGARAREKARAVLIYTARGPCVTSPGLLSARLRSGRRVRVGLRNLGMVVFQSEELSG